MTRGRVRAFVIVVDLLAAIAFVLVFPYHAPGYIIGLSLLASLAVMTGTGPVRIPSLKTSVSVTDAFVFTALGAFGPMPAISVDVLGHGAGSAERVALSRVTLFGSAVSNRALAAGSMEGGGGGASTPF